MKDLTLTLRTTLFISLPFGSSIALYAVRPIVGKSHRVTQSLVLYLEVTQSLKSIRDDQHTKNPNLPAAQGSFSMFFWDQNRKYGEQNRKIKNKHHPTSKRHGFRWRSSTSNPEGNGSAQPARSLFALSQLAGWSVGNQKKTKANQGTTREHQGKHASSFVSIFSFKEKIHLYSLSALEGWYSQMVFRHPKMFDQTLSMWRPGWDRGKKIM